MRYYQTHSINHAGRRPLFSAWEASVSALCGILVLFSPQPLLMGASLSVLLVAGYLFWRPGFPPVLLFVLFYQWAQVSGELFYSLFTGEPLYSVFVATSYLREATWLGLIGLLVLAAGMWIPVRSLKIQQLVERARDEIEEISIHRVFLSYLGVLGSVVIILPSVRGTIPSSAQILGAAAQLRWAAFFLLACAAIQKGEGGFYLALAVVFEMILGLGFFSKFKTVFFVLAIAVGTAYTQIKREAVISGIAVAATVILLGSVWTAVEGEYRQFLNQGTGQQAVRVSKWEQVQKFANMASSLSWEEIEQGATVTLKRVAYVKFFAATLDYVPDRRQHEGGEVWGRAIEHIVKPRIFFPDKPVLKSDSRITREYTGLQVAGGTRGTSISIGYMGESYVDFGRFGMFFPVLLLGLAWGGMLVYFMRSSPITVVGFAFAVAVLINANRFEITSIKLLGSVLMKFIVLALVMRFGMPHVGPWLFEGKNSI